MKKTLIKLRSNNLTIALAESMTGGYISHLLTKHKGASNVFKGAIIAYNKALKINVLNLDENLIKKYSVVSKEIANAMNAGLKKIIDSDIYISITGNAGPTLEEKTTKLEAYIAVSCQNESKLYNIIFKSKNRFKNIKTVTKFITKILANITT